VENESTIYNGSVLGSDEIPPPNNLTVSHLSNLIWKVIFSDVKWTYCFIGAAISHYIVYLYGTYMMLWLSGFIESGVLKDEKDVEAVFSMQTLVATPFSMVALFLSNRLMRYLDISVLIPFSFVGRGLFLYCFRYMKDPRSAFSLLVVAGLISFSAF